MDKVLQAIQAMDKKFTDAIQQVNDRITVIEDRITAMNKKFTDRFDRLEDKVDKILTLPTVQREMNEMYPAQSETT